MNKQEDFKATFDSLRAILRKFEKRLILLKDGENEYSLTAPYSERFRKEVWFGAVRIMKNYVSYHLIPVYAFPDLLDDVSATLRQRMQGRSCFNFTKISPELLQELESLTQRGLERYEKEKWV